MISIISNNEDYMVQIVVYIALTIIFIVFTDLALTIGFTFFREKYYNSVPEEVFINDLNFIINKIIKKYNIDLSTIEYTKNQKQNIINTIMLFDKESYKTFLCNLHFSGLLIRYYKLFENNNKTN